MSIEWSRRRVITTAVEITAGLVLLSSDTPESQNAENEREQRIRDFLERKARGEVREISRGSELWDQVGGVWIKPTENEATSRADTLELTAEPRLAAGAPSLYGVMFTADYPGRRSPIQDDPFAWDILDVVRRSNNPKRFGTSVTVGELGARSGQVIQLGFDVIVQEPGNGLLLVKESPHGRQNIKL